MKKKIVATVLAVVMAVSLAACGASSSTGSSTSGASAAASAGTGTSGNTSNSTGSAAGTESGTTKENLGTNDTLNDTAEVKTAYGEGTYLRDKVTVACSADGGTFDPFTRGNFGTIQLGLYQTLVQVDSQGNMKLQLLKSIEKEDDLTYKCTLWDFITDTDGNNITSSDVIFSFQKFIDSGNKGGVNKLDHMEVVDDHTFIWHCNEPFDLGEEGKNLSNVYIVSEKTYEAHNSDMTTNPSGTGPYKLKSYVAGSTVDLVANEDFWMRKIDDADWIKENAYGYNFQNVKEIEYQIIQDGASRAAALEMGNVDAADALNTADVDNFKANPDLGVTPINLPVDPPVAFYFNCNEASKCSDVNLRQAICYAINNAAVAAGLGIPAYEVFGISPNMLDAPKSWLTGEGREYYTYNLEKAKECLSKSSYDGSTLVIMYQSTTANDAATVMVQSELKEIGVEVELYPVEQSVLQQVQYDWTKWDIRFDTFGGGSYLSAVLKRWWTQDQTDTLKGLNVCGIADSKLDDLFVALKNDNSEANIDAWDDYFTNQMCYGYAVCGYYEQTACRSDVNAVLTGHNALTPGAFTYNK